MASLVLAQRLRLLFASVAFVGAAVVSIAESAPELTADELALLDSIGVPAWDFTGSLRGGFGYKDNLLLSAIRQENSGFAQAEAELFAWRLPTERFEAMAFTNATLTRFFDSKENPREVQAFLHGEARWFATPALQATAALEGYHLDQVLDLSATAAERLNAQLAVRGLVATTEFRWHATPDTWLEVKPGTQRDTFEDGSDDHRQHFGRVGLGHSLMSGRVEFVAAMQVLRREYDRREQYTSDGYPVGRSHLVFEQRETEFSLKAAWDEARTWTSSTALVLLDNDDNGAGYFDYRHRFVRHEVTWTRAPWKVRLTGRAGRYEYPVQRVRTPLAPLREKDEFLLQARIERELTPELRLYADYLWERSRSNDPLATYRVKTMSAGLDWAF